MEPRLKRLAVIGAGPMGLEAALRGAARGWEVTVYERDRVGASLRRWSHVRFFTPVRDNVSEFLWESLKNSPDPSSYLTGGEFVEQILRPVAETVLQGKIREGASVRSISRRRLRKQELPGHPLRSERPFQLLIQNSSGAEEVAEADIVLDAGGVYGNPNWAGESGIPAPGEKAAAARFCRHLPDIRGADKKDWLGQEILLIGHGHSAATAIGWLSELAKEDPSTRVHWVVKADRSRPCVEAAEDPLPERKRTVETANNLAERPPEGWTVYRKSALLALVDKGGEVEAVVGRGENRQRIRIQKILSLTGYRPDTSNAEELQVQLSPVTGGAAGLAKSLLTIKDCLSPMVVPAENLESGESGFYLVGHKSYGRLPTFLLKSGLQQLDMIFERLNPSASGHLFQPADSLLRRRVGAEEMHQSLAAKGVNDEKVGRRGGA